MAVYRVILERDGGELQRWEVITGAGCAWDEVTVNPDGSEEPLIWTEEEASEDFEQGLESALMPWNPVTVPAARPDRQVSL